MNFANSVFGELKVVFPVDCGNAPRKIVLKNLNIAFATHDADFISEHIIDDLHWNIVGNKFIQGKESLSAHLKQEQDEKISELHISNIITHGPTASVNGELIFECKKNYGFCNVYHFTSAGKNAKIKEITTYLITISE